MIIMDELINALAETNYQFAHYAWSKAPDGDYGTYSEDSGADLVADEQHIERGTVVYINYFTRDDTGTPRTTIETALNSLNLPWYLNSVQYENDTGYIHYEWSVGVFG